MKLCLDSERKVRIFQELALSPHCRILLHLLNHIAVFYFPICLLPNRTGISRIYWLIKAETVKSYSEYSVFNSS